MKERSSPVGSSKPFDGPSLLDGEYNEYDAHAEFQSALVEWRNNKGAQKQAERKKSHLELRVHQILQVSSNHTPRA